MFSYHASGRSHAAHRDEGQTIERPRGSRWMHTFRKLPTARPIAANTTMPTASVTADLPAAWAGNDWDVKYLKLRQAVVYGRPKDAKVTLAAIREAVQQASRAAAAEATHDAR